MISSLHLINFKKFEDQLLEFKPLTLISGLNSTGKSSVLQSLLLLRQSSQQNLLPNIGLALNGELVNIGTAQDAFYESGKENLISLEIIWENYKSKCKCKWVFKYDPDQKDEDVLNIISEPDDSYQSNLFSNNFHFLQAERIGPRSFNEISDYKVRRCRQIGTRGEYTAHFLYIYGREPIPIENLSYPEAKSMDLIDQVEAWMREVSPGIRIEIKANPEMGLVNIQYFYGESNRYRATNVGFGITYTLPIIVAILSSYPGTLILVENPEAHLHPRGQAKMGELLALAASCGVQVVIETHSDHVLNGIRLAVHAGKIKPESVQLHYFKRQEKQGQGFTEVVSPRINRSGRIDKWPDGFFDEWDKSLEVLLEPVEE
ncbi:MAG: DUF3696 domain-containing protein [Dolichospermum sp. DL01]|nr:MAG: DUF3696 domain-containing protein [Dolichospermum sp. DL01]